MYFEQLHSQFLSSCKLINQNTLKVSIKIIKKIQKIVEHQQQKNYLFYKNPELYLTYMRSIAIDQIEQQNNQYLTPLLLNTILNRQKHVYELLQNNQIQIQKTAKTVNYQDNRAVELPTLNHQEIIAHHKNIVKNYFTFLQKQKEQKKSIELAKLRQIHSKEDKKNKIKQIQEQKRNINKEDRHKVLSEQFKKNQETRHKLKQLRSYRDKQYHFILKNSSTHTPLFQKMQTNFSQRYRRQASQQENKLRESKLRYFKPIDQMNLESHQKKYQAWKQEDENKRLERLEQHQKMLQLYEQELAKKYKINNQDEQGADFQASKTSRYNSQLNYVNLKQEQRRKAFQRRKKNIKYFQQIVKPHHKPIVDQHKRKQLLNLIKDMEIKKLKKVKNQNGQISYEQVKPSDPKIIGLEYLEKSKQIGMLMKGKKRKLSQQKIQTKSQRKSFDYLQQRRNNPSQLRKSNRFSFLQKQDLSFDQKMTKVQLQTQKLQQSTQQSQIQLKFGKFKTSEQILQHKQSIDLNHIQILKMKLKLVNQKK